MLSDADIERLAETAYDESRKPGTPAWVILPEDLKMKWRVAVCEAVGSWAQAVVDALRKRRSSRGT